MSTRPNSSTVRCTMSTTSDFNDTSVGTASTVPPASRISAAASSARARSSSAMTTAAPSFARARETARPMPGPPPAVTMAILPSRNIWSDALVDRSGRSAATRCADPSAPVTKVPCTNRTVAPGLGSSARSTATRTNLVSPNCLRCATIAIASCDPRVTNPPARFGLSRVNAWGRRPEGGAGRGWPRRRLGGPGRPSPDSPEWSPARRDPSDLAGRRRGCPRWPTRSSAPWGPGP